MEVHHGYDVNRVRADAVNDRVWKSLEVEFAIFAADFAASVLAPRRRVGVLRTKSLPLRVPRQLQDGLRRASSRLRIP